MEGLQQDSTYNRTGIRLSALLRLDRWSEIGGRFSREVTRPGQAGAQFDNGRQRVGRNTGTWAGVELRINRLDNRIAPRKGLSLWTTLERGYRDSERRKIADGDTVRISQRDSQERLEVGLRVHGLNRGRFGGLVGVDAHLIRSEDLDESDLFFMGGASSLRGYDENRFRGSTLVRAFAEPRYHLDDGSMVFLFVDMGYVESSLTKDSKGSWYPGYGIGLRILIGYRTNINFLCPQQRGWMEGRKGSCCRIIWPLSAHPSSTTTPSNCLPTRSSMPSSTEKHRFYAPPDQIAGDVAVFTEEESRHVIKVLRLGVGDVVTVVNGDGLTCRAELEMISKRSVLARILERKEEVGEPSFDLHIGLSVLNQPTRWETFLEKAVENGCTRITPLVSQRTQKVKFNRRRLESILVSALKQSERSRLPVARRSNFF